MNHKKIIFSVFGLSFLFLNAFSQDKYKEETDQQGDKILVGQLNLQLLANDPTFAWFYQGINAYKPDEEWINYLKFYRDSFQLVAFTGTWDANSKVLIPQFYRVLMGSSYPLDRVKNYGVNEKLEALNGETGKYDVKTIPTIIIYDNNQIELGRIQGVSDKSVEYRMAGILQTKFFNKK